MIIREIRKQIKTCGKTRYQIAKESGVSESQLCKIMQGGSCKAETADVLLKYFGLGLKPTTSSTERQKRRRIDKRRPKGKIGRRKKNKKVLLRKRA